MNLKNMPIIAVAIVPLAMPIATPIRGEQTTVQALYQWCQDENDVKATACIAYVAGVADVMVRNSALRDQVDGDDRQRLALYSVCVKGANFGAAAQTFMNWAARHPEKANEPRVDGVMTALHETWPCTQLH
jgi:hypothetical protein